MTEPAAALQRTEGVLRLRFAARGGVTAAAESFQSGALRVRFPRAPLEAVPEAVLINTAGGLTGGDVLRIEVALGEGARAVLCSQACEKIYKSSQGAARIRTTLDLSAGAALDYLPQPTILFDRARLDRETRIGLAGESRLLALEAGILGRTAMGEEFTDGALRDVWRIARDGRFVFADALRLEGAEMRALRSPWGLDHACAYANLVYAAPDAERRIDEMRDILAGIAERGAASAWDGMLVTRLIAQDGYTLIRDIVHILKTFRRTAMPRLWSI